MEKIKNLVEENFSPVILVYASQDAEEVISKNNLRPVELFQPFERVTKESTF
jgi:acyl-CoA reductase-like NAD-dependent aldehyde dehydrogenase